MIPLKYIRENKKIIKDTLKAKKVKFDLDKLLQNDEKWREFLKKCEDLKSIRNSVSKEIAQLKSQGKDCEGKISYMKEVSEKIKESDKGIDSLQKSIDHDLLYILALAYKKLPNNPLQIFS